MYYWVVAIDSSAKLPFELYGPYNSKTAAQSYADRSIDTDFEIMDIPTRNRVKATDHVKAKLAEKFKSSKVGRIRHPQEEE